MSPASQSGWSGAEGPGRKVWGGLGGPPPPVGALYAAFLNSLAAPPFTWATDGDSAGWSTDLDYHVTGAGEGYPNQHIYIGHGPVGNVVSVTTLGPALGNSYCLFGFEILDYSGLAVPLAGRTQIGTDAGGPAFRWPSTVLAGRALLIAAMTRMTSALPWNQPEVADGWSNVESPQGTSVSTVTIVAGNQTFVTQAGLPYFAGLPVIAHSTLVPTDYVVGIVVSYIGTTLIMAPHWGVGIGNTYSSWGLAVSFWDQQDLGDRQLVNAEQQVAPGAGTYAGLQAPDGSEGGNTAGVVVMAFGGIATLGRRGNSGNGSNNPTCSATLL